MSGQWHPDTEELASLRAGIAGRLHGRRLASHVARCAHCASVSEQLDAVSSVLASVPAPTLPDSFESRITAALAAEGATRAARQGAASTAGVSTGAAEHAADADSAERIASHRRPSPARSRRQLSLRLQPAMGAALLIVFLVVGFGYLVSRSNGSSSSSSSALSEGAATSVPAATTAPSRASSAAGSAALPEPSASAPDSRTAPNRPAPPFTVIASDRNYSAAGLAAQVQGEVDQVMAKQNGTVGSPVPSAQASGTYAASKAARAPLPALIGCVRHLAGSAPVDLVEQASYQGRPVYVIATATRAWVVGLTCTAGNPGVIAKVTLSTAP
jgi:hypothetical protein